MEKKVRQVLKDIEDSLVYKVCPDPMGYQERKESLDLLDHLVKMENLVRGVVLEEMAIPGQLD